MSFYRYLVQWIALAMMLLGLAMIVVTLSRGFGVGIILGLLFIAAGSGRLWMIRRK
jgi:cytochrome oxidase assembly protein ShyY1